MLVSDFIAFDATILIFHDLLPFWMKFAESDAPAADVKGVIKSFKIKIVSLKTEMARFRQRRHARSSRAQE